MTDRHTSGLGHLAAWHLPGGPVGPAFWWAATSNVEVGQQGKGREGGERRERGTIS